ncbi:hypothetical protein CF326_g3894 [Tilletia indica]|nr:hypothetical protein CF326_g3894 [Tilletia indica]
MDTTVIKDALLTALRLGQCPVARPLDDYRYRKACSTIVLSFSSPNPPNPPTLAAMREAIHDMIGLGSPITFRGAPEYTEAIRQIVNANVWNVREDDAMTANDFAMSDREDEDLLQQVMTTVGPAPESLLPSPLGWGPTTSSTTALSLASTTAAGMDSDAFCAAWTQANSQANSGAVTAGWDELTSQSPTVGPGQPDQSVFRDLCYRRLRGFAFRRMRAMVLDMANAETNPTKRALYFAYYQHYRGAGGAERMIADASKWVNFSVRKVYRPFTKNGGVDAATPRKPYYLEIYLVNTVLTYFVQQQTGYTWVAGQGMVPVVIS